MIDWARFEAERGAEFANGADGIVGVGEHIQEHAERGSVLGASVVSVGTPVGLLFALLASGVAIDKICDHYPWLDAEEVRRVLESNDVANQGESWLAKLDGREDRELPNQRELF